MLNEVSIRVTVVFAGHDIAPQTLGTHGHGHPPEASTRPGKLTSVIEVEDLFGGIYSIQNFATPDGRKAIGTYKDTVENQL